jgi:hypothetical protein
MRNRTARADFPPESPLINKFAPGRLPSSPLPTESGNVMSEEKWINQTNQVQWGDQGNGNYGPQPWPLTPSTDVIEQGLGRNASVNSQRETMRVFPNGRQKLGGKEFPTNF